MATLVGPTALVLDCADAAALADFYHKATGWAVTSSDTDSAYLSDGGSVQLGFQRVADYRPVSWPADGPQVHIDFQVADLEVATKELLALGASVPDEQPGGNDWRVLTDPAGHPFCIAAG
jgi:predicted enzyme related to lactoylglutathione lyase